MKTKVTGKYQYIQLRNAACKDFGVVLQDKHFKDVEVALEDCLVNTTYLDSKRAKKLAFALLSAANKLERIEKLK